MDGCCGEGGVEQFWANVSATYIYIYIKINVYLYHEFSIYICINKFIYIYIFIHKHNKNIVFIEKSSNYRQLKTIDNFLQMHGAFLFLFKCDKILFLIRFLYQFVMF